MRKIIVSILSTLCLVFSLTGCAKCINTEYKTVEVEIVNEYFQDSYTTYMWTGKCTIPVHHSAEYEITVKYNGINYRFDGEDIYNKYKNKIGQTAMATLEIRTYDDGTVRYNITGLE